MLNVYSTTAILYSPLTFIGVATTVYGLWGAEAIKTWLPWFTFGHLIGIMVIFVLLMMVFFYKVIIPSIYAFQVQQQYKHRNPLVSDVGEVLERLDETNKQLTETNKRIKELEDSVEELKESRS